MTATERGAIYALSESSPVRLGLVLVLVGMVAAAWVRVQSSVEDARKEQLAQFAEFARSTVPRDLFTARMDSVAEDIAELKSQVRAIEQQLYGERK